MNTTRAERVGYTVDLLTYHTNMHLISSSDLAALYADDLKEALQHPNHEATFGKIDVTNL